jgi:hypothetical protein
MLVLLVEAIVLLSMSVSVVYNLKHEVAVEGSWIGREVAPLITIGEHDAGMSGELSIVCLVSGKMKWCE